MVTRDRSRGPARVRVSRWLLALGALAGLFAMHGLSGHGMAGHAQRVESALLSTASMAADLAPAHHAPAEQAAASISTLVSASHPDPGHDMGPVGLCLAVLLLAVFWLLSSPAGRLLRRFSSRRPAARTRVVRARDPDPPDLTQLSILRC